MQQTCVTRGSKPELAAQVLNGGLNVHICLTDLLYMAIKELQSTAEMSGHCSVLQTESHEGAVYPPRLRLLLPTCLLPEAAHSASTRSHIKIS